MVKRESSWLRSETEHFNRVFRRVSAPRGTSRFCNLEYCSLNQLVEDLERSENMLFNDAALFAHFNVLINQSNRERS